MTPESVALNIRIVFPEEQITVADDVFKAGVERRITELLDDLGLPTPKISIDCDEADCDSNRIRQPRVLIEDQPCRQEIGMLHEPAARNREKMANYVVSVLYENRARLLTPHLLGAITSSHSQYVASQLPRVISHGGSLAVATSVVKESGTPSLAGDARYAFELSLAQHTPRMVKLEAGSKLFEQFTDNLEHYQQHLALIHTELFNVLGVVFPPVSIEHSEELRDHKCRISIGVIRGPVHGMMEPNEFLVSADPESMRLLGWTARPAHNPLGRPALSIVSGSEAATELQGFTVWDNGDYAMALVARVFRLNAPQFVTIAHVQGALSRLAEAFPMLVVDVLERFSPVFVTDVLRALVSEEVSVRNLRSVLEAMLEINGRRPARPNDAISVAPPTARLAYAGVPSAEGSDANQCADYVREVMRTALTHAITRGEPLHVVETTAATEARLREASGLKFTDSMMDVVSSVAVASEAMPAPNAVVTAPNVRRQLREAIRVELPFLPVLSRDELDESVFVLPMGSVSMESEI